MSVLEKAIVRFSMYKPNERGHGGEKRTAQLFELFQFGQLTVIDFENNNRPITKMQKLNYAFLGLKILKKQKRLSCNKKSLNEAVHIGYSLYALEQLVKKAKLHYVVTSFVWEFTFAKHWFMPLIAKKVGLKVIAVPHNMESLVYSQKSHKTPKVKSPDWLEEELEYLSWSDDIFCISREEYWLLSLTMQSSNVYYLPYTAPKEVFSDLLKIRDLRTSKSIKNEILILGSAINPPTLHGMKLLKKELEQEIYKKITFNFVGFGVTRLQTEKDNFASNIVIHDSVSNDELKTFLTQAERVIIYQIPSTGALTKINELQTAGIPVLVNATSARSYYNKSGIVVFETLEQLKTLLLDSEQLEIPTIQQEVAVHKTNFINAIA